MNTSELEKMVKELHTVADELENHLPANNILYFRDFIECDEVGEGLEILLTQIDESNLSISKKSYDILKSAAQYAKIDINYIERIKHN